MTSPKAPIRGKATSRGFAKRALDLLTANKSYKETAEILSVHPRTIRRIIAFHFPEIYNNETAIIPKQGGRTHKNASEIAALYMAHAEPFTSEPETFRQLTLYKRINTADGFISLYNSLNISDVTEFHTAMRAQGYTKAQILEAEALASIEHKRDPNSRVAVNSILTSFQAVVEETFYEDPPEHITIHPTPEEPDENHT